MCGITGILNLDGAPADRERASVMTDILRHRGPDGSGIHASGPCVLGHRRLSIIDPSEGVQPMGNEDGSIHVSFNGEIYNYRELAAELQAKGHVFRTHSDTETIVHAWEEWGEDCLSRLRGMFAFAIWDAKQQRLFIARDRVGIKPLYYSATRQRIAFASELQSLRTLPDLDDDLDLQAVDLYLHFQYIPAPYTIYRGVRKLPPGTCLSIGPDGKVGEPRAYWNLEYQPDESKSEADWIEEIDAALRESIRLHLRSDVPYGAFLSGGLDSSTVVAYMSELLDEPVRTFTITFDEDEYNEADYARQAAKRFGTEHHEERVKTDALGILPDLVRHYGEPFADSSAVPTWYVSRLAASQVKMVLSGDGGDETFAGYSHYAYLKWSHRRPAGAARKLKYQAGNLLRAAGIKEPLPAPEDSWFRRHGYFIPELREKLWQPTYRSCIPGTRAWYDTRFDRAPAGDLVSRFQYIDQTNYLPFDILTKVDVASMYHSLEVRVPLLDHVFLETAARIPSRFKLHGDCNRDTFRETRDAVTQKYLLKKNAERFFDPEFIHRKKRGFDLPVKPWFAGPARDQVRERLLDPGAPVNDYFEQDCMRTLIEEHGSTDHAWRIWTLLFFNEWCVQHRAAPAHA